MTKTLRSVALALAAALMAPLALAHHSFAAFDLNRTVTLEGELTEVKFTNPHSWFELKVADAKGGEQRWAVEGLSPQQLVAKGLKRTAMKVGDKVSITVNPLRDGTPGGSLVSVKLADGTVITGGPGQ